MALSRRDLFRAVPLAAVAGISGGLHPRLARAAAADGMIVRMQEPRNLETQLSDLGGKGHFYVRSHFAVPTIDHTASETQLSSLAAV